MKESLLATIPATIPTLAVLVGILLNQNGLARLEARINTLEARLDGRINSLEARVDSLSGRISELEARFHEDILMLIGWDTDKSERVARLEERSKS